MDFSNNTFNNSTEVDCSNYEHKTMPHATLAVDRHDPLDNSPEFCVKNYMTGDVYFVTNSLASALIFCNDNFDTNFNLA